jgi:methionine sulfoxide reductase heme-binding subunit
MMPSPLWYATRGAGVVGLLLLTAVVVLGLATTTRREGSAWPRFLSSRMHGNIAWLAVVFLVIHVVTAVTDPFAHLGWRDALVPFGSRYRPLWLGLGVVSAELVGALVITSLLRSKLKYRNWRLVHWTAFACWPLAVLHGLGTGTDVRTMWFLAVDALCVVAVGAAIVMWRLTHGWPRAAGFRLGVALSTGVGIVALTLWTVNGPLAPGWARAAGTPPDLLHSPSVPASPTPPADPPLASSTD